MKRTTLRPSRRAAAAVAVLLLIASAVAHVPVAADDRDLLKENSTEPFLFLLVDSSLSMATTIDGDWLEAGSSDPRSKLYQVKEALYQLLKNEDEVAFGFATFNQDELRVTSKHFLYFVEDSVANATLLAGASFPIDYPIVEPGNIVEIADLSDPDFITYDVDIDGDMMNFGKDLGLPATSPGMSCTDPLVITDAGDRAKLNRIAKLGIDSTTSTLVFVKGGNGAGLPIYRLTVSNPGATKLGAATLPVTFQYDTVTCAAGVATTVTVGAPATLDLILWREFLMTDSESGVFAAEIGRANNDGETVGTAPWSFLDTQGSYSCGEEKPFSGSGWEGNYDTGDPFTTPATAALEASFIGAGSSTGLLDTWCMDPSNKTTATCINLQHTTTLDAVLDERVLDSGDLLPFSWLTSNKDEMLKRLNPMHPTVTSQSFGDAVYFKDEPDSDPLNPLGASGAGLLELEDPTEKPIVAAGPSPIGGAALDFRCYYTGNDHNKCGSQHELYEDASGDPRGFMQLLKEQDPAIYGCRQPYLIIISDLESNCPGEADVANVAGMNSGTRDGGPQSSGMSTWVFNVGTASGNSIANAGKGEEIAISSKQVLKDELTKIIGIIKESSRAFATAAVPSVQADVSDQIYLTTFTPAQGAAKWPGHAHAFVKPLPTTQPDPSRPPRPNFGHVNHQWDAGESFYLGPKDASTVAPGDRLAPQSAELADLSIPTTLADLKLGLGEAERLVFFGLSNTTAGLPAGSVPLTRQLLGPVESGPAGVNLHDIREELWTKLGTSIPLVWPADETVDPYATHPAETGEAHDVFIDNLAVLETDITDPETGITTPDVPYVLGDIFHSNPQIIGSPDNGTYLSNPDVFKGYRFYAREQGRRRKLLVFGANDGFLHAFEAGTFTVTNQRKVCATSLKPCASNSDCTLTGEVCETKELGDFNTGSGRELFAFAPSVALPSLTVRAQDVKHQWGVDGSPVAADVFIDPIHDGTPTVTDRRWRTLLITGLREGGAEYFALDISHPDPVQEVLETDAQGNEISFGFLPLSTGPVPDCVDGIGSGGPCKGAYPQVLWEFADDADLDADGEPDLGEAWSTPNVGAIKVLDPAVTDDPSTPDLNESEKIVYVAVFGGGLDPGHLLTSGAGNFLYMVDVETGKWIYKRRLGPTTAEPTLPSGSAAAEPAAVDTDLDGFIDLVFIGTTAGVMYRVDLRDPQLLESPCPITGADSCVTDSDWDPVAIFDTLTTELDADGNPAAVRRPIFFRPAVFFAPELGRYGLSFGTGDRDNLWSPAPLGGNRFYTFIDDTDQLSAANALRHETDFEELSTQVATGDPDYLQELGSLNDGKRGWFLSLGAAHPDDPSLDANDFFDPIDERMVNPATSLSGLTVFSTFLPFQLVGQVGQGNNATFLCARQGSSRNYLMLTTNGDAILTANADGGGGGVDANNDGICDNCNRARGNEKLVSEVFVSRGGTTNPDTSAGSAGVPCPESDSILDRLRDEIFPPNCTFTTQHFDLEQVQEDTGVICIVQVPVCVIGKNWTEPE